MSASANPRAQRTWRPNVRGVIFVQMEAVAAQQNKTLAPLSDDLKVLESGLDSLCVAILVANLEDELGVDPFSLDDGREMPVTIGEFVGLYEHALTVRV